MDSLTETLEAFHFYLTDPLAIEFSHLDFYRKENSRIHKDFYKTKINKRPYLTTYVQEILSYIGVPPAQWGRFTDSSLTFHEFLQEVNDLTLDRNRKVKELLSFIEHNNATTQRNINLFVGGSLLLFGIVPPVAAYLGYAGLSLIQSLLAVTIFVPCVSLVYTIGVGAYSLYRSYNDKKISWEDRFRENASLLASSTFNVAAYSILIAAATSFNPVAATFFVLASLVTVVKESLHLLQANQQEANAHLGDIYENKLASKQEQARINFMRTQQKNAVGIELGGAILKAAVIAVWCFVPGGIFLSIAAVSAIVLISAAKMLASSYSESTVKANLLKEFEILEKKDELVQNEKLLEQELTKTNSISQILTLGLKKEDASALDSSADADVGMTSKDEEASFISRPSEGGMFKVNSPRTFRLEEPDTTPEDSPTIH